MAIVLNAILHKSYFNAAAIREYSLKLNKNIAICVTSVQSDSMRLERLNVWVPMHFIMIGIDVDVICSIRSDFSQ